MAWGVWGIDKNDLLAVWPNPTKEIIYFRLPSKHLGSNGTYQILSVSGLVSMESSFKSLDNEIIVTTLPKGVYTIRIMVKGEVFNQRIIKL